MAAVSLVVYELTWGDGVIPYLGLTLGNLPRALGPGELLVRGEALVQAYPSLATLAVLWAVMAGVISAAQWFGLWALGLALAVVGGVLGYALAVSVGQGALFEAMTSLGLGAIIYGVVKYLGFRFGR
jgi:hypothetical protein